MAMTPLSSGRDYERGHEMEILQGKLINNKEENTTKTVLSIKG